ncbi:DUF11 domain-containing protein [Aquisphaera insulae]|uniref:DUF11 domain-containing protein n=1 Tax=Aquisphaera insulae TaxID=2712864 RepID=UPI0013EA9877|nr:DUF11 domain-containing protein [Aquisphaera insulae]
MTRITVTGTGDAIDANDGQVTLREAITAANTNRPSGDAAAGSPGLDTIAFDIPGLGVRTIRPTSALPVITEPVIIDGYTQPGSAPNTNPVGQGLNGTLLVEIDGEDAGDVRFGMIQIQASDSTVRGLVINRTRGVKIGILSGSTAGNNRIEGNYIGTDATGTAGFAADANPNFFDRHGISVRTVGNTIGGTTPAARNLISGNVDRPGISTAFGVLVNASFPAGISTIIQGNLIGTDVTGTRALGNDSGGVWGLVAAETAGPVIVGGAGPGEGNLISGNGGIGVGSRNGVVEGNFIGTDVTGTLPLGNRTGVQASGNVRIAGNAIAFNTVAGVDNSGDGNLITRNAIFSNAGPGIGRTFYLDDAVPDADGTQNYPVLDAVTAAAAGTHITGTLASKPSSSFRLEFFANAVREDAFDDPVNSGVFGQGRSFVGTIDVTTDAAGLATFTADLPTLPAGQPFVTATATDVTDDGSGPRNDTSPFSPVAVPGGPSFVVTSTGDTGLGTLREAIYNANFAAGAQTITFAIPAADPRHFYYRDDGIAGEVTPAAIAATTAADDAGIADIDPDWPHSWYSIRPDHDLPRIVDTVTIDGYSQPGSRRNTLPALQALDTVLRIELVGTAASGNGLELKYLNGTIDAASSRIDGLAINGFGGSGIRVSTLGGGTVIAGNFIGTDVSGTVDLGNRGDGIYLFFENGATIGGAEAGDRNLISANDDNGIRLYLPTGVSVLGNLIGLDRIAEFGLPNQNAGILITDDEVTSLAAVRSLSLSSTAEAAPGTSGAAIRAEAQAADSSDETNEIDLNRFPGYEEGQALGVSMSMGGEPGKPLTQTRVRQFARILHRSRRSSNNLKSMEAPSVSSRSLSLSSAAATATSGPAFLGIDLGQDGITPNDPGDRDDGPNDLQNFPVLTSASTHGGATVVQGTLNSLASCRFQIDLYSSSGDTTVIRAGEQFLGSVEVTTDAAGNASFAFASPIVVPVGQSVISTATLLDGGGTSEFSDGIVVDGSSVPTTADLSVSLSPAPGRPVVGGDLTYTLTVSNAGPGTATGVRLVVTPPAGATFVSATGGNAPVGGVLTFDLGVLVAGSTGSVVVVVRPSAAGALTSTASVSASQVDPTPANNSGTNTISATGANPGGDPGTGTGTTDTIRPTVVGVARLGTVRRPRGIVVTYSEDLDPTRAAALASYRLILRGRDGRFGTADDVRRSLKAVSYDVSTRSVTLLPRKGAVLSRRPRLVIDGSTSGGVADRAGNLLDGNYVGLVRPARLPRP